MAFKLHAIGPWSQGQAPQALAGQGGPDTPGRLAAVAMDAYHASTNRMLGLTFRCNSRFVKANILELHPGMPELGCYV